ncbi:MAG: dephospho-CoA kinase [Gammaproteobacteria bacterium]
MLTVGLTGGIGSGKTTVSNLFEELGITIIDTDVIAHELVNNSSVLNEIVDTFGQKVLNQDETLDRKKLADIIFNQKTEKQRLENILHPRIRSKVNEQIQRLRSSENPPHYVIVVIPLLFETGFADITDRIIVVMSDEENRINRIMQRDNRSTVEIRSIINHQVSDETRLRDADDIIENNHDIEDLKPQILQLHKKYSTLSTPAE